MSEKPTCHWWDDDYGWLYADPEDDGSDRLIGWIPPGAPCPHCGAELPEGGPGEGE